MILWDIETGDSIQKFEDQTEEINYITFSKDNEYIISANDTRVNLWNIKTGKTATSYNKLKGDILSPNMKYYIVSQGSNLILHNTIKEDRYNKIFADSLLPTNIDDQYIAYLSNEGDIKFWDINLEKDKEGEKIANDTFIIDTPDKIYKVYISDILSFDKKLNGMI